MNTLEILKKKIEKCDKIELVSYEELKTKYLCKIKYGENEAIVDIPKICTPGSHHKVVVQNIYSAIASIYFNRGDYENAKKWLCKRIGD